MGGTWLLPEDIRWSRLLGEVSHDFYHLPCYAQVADENDGGSPLAYYDGAGSGGAFLIPLIQKRTPFASASNDQYDAASPYGYASPLCHDGIGIGDLRRAFQGFIATGARAGLVSTFLRLHPLLSQTVARALSGIANVTVFSHGDTVSIDLTLSEQALDGQLKTNHKRNIKKLHARGFTTRMDDWADFPAFRRMYARTMQRVGAANYYYFGAAYFSRLRECLGEALHLCTVRSDRGEIVSGGLFTKIGRIVEYHLGATADGYEHLAPSKLMFYVVRNWAKQENAEVFHLGGGVGGKTDSLYEFKKGFATHVHEFQTVRIVHNALLYHELTRRWRTVTRAGGERGDNYFPINRRHLGGNRQEAEVEAMDGRRRFEAVQESAA
jgi:hypothetical protein